MSKRIRWDIDRDVIRGRRFDFGKKFLPDGLSQVDELRFLDARRARFLSQIQGRTYANIFGLVERFIGAKMLEVSRDHWLGDQVALEALVRLTDEELKHQELFRRIEAMMARAACRPATVRARSRTRSPAPCSRKSTWAVLGADAATSSCSSQAHYRESIEPDPDSARCGRTCSCSTGRRSRSTPSSTSSSGVREDASSTDAERDAAVDDLIELVGAVDGILQAQAAADADYFLRSAGRALTARRATAIHATVLQAYRWQYIVSGVQEPRFLEVLGGMITPEQGARIHAALGRSPPPAKCSPHRQIARRSTPEARW